jgi:hypothetical protein
LRPPRSGGVTGKYFESKSEKRSSEESYDEKEALALWDATSKMVGLSN